MKKIISIFLTILLLGSVVACSNSMAEKATEQGKLALASKDYDKALASFELAINEGSKDEEVKKMIAIIKNYKEALKLFESKEIEKSKEIVSNIDKGYKNYAINEDIDNLEKSIDEQISFNENFNKNVEELNQLCDQGEFEKCKEKIKELKSNNLNDNQKKTIEEIEVKISELENIREQEAREEESKKLQNKTTKSEKKTSFTWDDAINIITRVIGPEDGTFIYNGRTDVNVDSQGRRNCTVWKEDPNAESTADGTIASYTVYEDGTVEPY